MNLASPTCRRKRVALVAAAANRGGAHVAALRLHRGLREVGCDSTYVAGLVDAGLPEVGAASSGWQAFAWKARSRIGRSVARWRDPGSEGMQSVNLLPSGLPRRLNRGRFDVVHLHWINNELLSIGEIGRIRAPMVWTLHDMWAFCGSEHYLADPDAYLGPPGTAPAVGPSSLARWTWDRKRRGWAEIAPILVAPSRWLGDLASRSRLLGHLRVEIVPYGLDLAVFRPITSPETRNGGPRRVVFGAAGGGSDRRKGFDLFAEAFRKWATSNPCERIELTVYGEPDLPEFGVLPESVRVRNAGLIRTDAAMADVLREADVFVAPSRLDNLPNTVMEATSCGVPTVAFRIGGMPDMIDHEVSGYLARPFEVDDLARGVGWVLADDGRLAALKTAARRKAEAEFGSRLQAERMLQIYEEAMVTAG